MSKPLSFIRPLLVGLSTYLPGINALRSRYRGTGGSGSARYCYSVWLRHAVMLDSLGARLNNAVVAELGPGDSVGVGIASLLTGSARHINLDVVRYADPKRNLQVLNEIVELVQQRVAIPHDEEFAGVEPKLDDYRFPAALFPDSLLASALANQNQIRADLLTPEQGGAMLGYKVPWNKQALIEPDSIDVVVSQAVLQSVNDLSAVYATLHRWLKPGGMMSHSIDFGCLGMADTWDGHRAYGSLLWTLIKGRRPHSLNRLTLSAHLTLLHELNFEVLLVKPVTDQPTLPRNKLAKPFQQLDEEDLQTRTAFIVARKKG